MPKRSQAKLVVRTVLGPIIDSATVEVRDPGTTDPISETIYGHPTDQVILTQPLEADAQGRIEFWLDRPKRVDLLVTDGATSRTVRDVEVHPAADEVSLELPAATPVRWVSGEGDDDLNDGLSPGLAFASATKAATDLSNSGVIFALPGTNFDLFTGDPNLTVLEFGAGTFRLRGAGSFLDSLRVPVFDAGELPAAVEMGRILVQQNGDERGLYLDLGAEQLKLDETYRPEWWGAKGDGQTEDTTAIQAANAATAKGGGVLLFGPKTYVSATVTLGANTTAMGFGSGASIIKRPDSGSSRALFWDGVDNVTVKDLGFDINGDVSSFGNAVEGQKCDNARVKDCRFFDSNPETASAQIGTGDGATTTFSATFSDFVDRMVLPGTVSVDAGDQTGTDNWRGGWLGDPSGGLIEYGDNNSSWQVSVTFPTPPPSGQAITVSWGRCDQRQPILLLDCSRCYVEGNILTHGGRVKVGRPGNRCVIVRNIFHGVNDNGITVVGRDIAGVEDKSTELIVSGNIIYFPAATGIFVGADGESHNSSDISVFNGRVTDNIIVGNSMNGITYIAPQAAGRMRIERNTVERIGTMALFARVGILTNGVQESSFLNQTMLSVNDNQVEGAFQTGIQLIGRRVHACRNQLRGPGMARAFRLLDLSEAKINDNIVQDATRAILSIANRSYFKVEIAHNFLGFTNDAANGACVLFDNPAQMDKVRLLFNQVTTTGTASMFVLRIDGTTGCNVDFIGNDYSEDTNVVGIGLIGGATLSSNSQRYGNKGIDARTITEGGGDPEGSVAAPVGSVRQRRDGGLGTSVYLKESGTGNTGWGPAPTHRTGTAVWDPPEVLDGEVASTTVSVTGAVGGDPVVIGFSRSMPVGVILSGQVTAADTVTVTLLNMSGSNVDLGSGTLKASALKVS